MSRLISFLKTNQGVVAILIALVIAIKVVMLDQVTKQVVLEYFDAGNTNIEALPFLNIIKVYNKGVSFGILGDMNNGNLILSIVATSVIVGLWIWFLHNIYTSNLNNWRSLFPIAVGLITGGGIGNLIDRVLHKAVVDFIDFHWKDWHYPAFNIADSAIVVGVIILALRTLIVDE